MCELSDNNVAAEVFDKLGKYKDFKIKIEKMCHLKAKTILVVVSELGLIPKVTTDFIEKTPRCPSLSEMQKIPVIID